MHARFSTRWGEFLDPNTHHSHYLGRFETCFDHVTSNMYIYIYNNITSYSRIPNNIQQPFFISCSLKGQAIGYPLSPSSSPSRPWSFRCRPCHPPQQPNSSSAGPRGTGEEESRESISKANRNRKTLRTWEPTKKVSPFIYG